MTGPIYVSPEQLMRDKAEFAKKGISRGRAIVVIRSREGVLFVAHNPGASLFKISEIYDRIGFAGAGRYSEFEELRKAGVRHADVTGFTYSREDVTAKSLANGYSQMLGQAFSHDMKPLEVELMVAEAGSTPENDQLYRISFDGTISGEGDFDVVGGDADRVKSALERQSKGIVDLPRSLSLCKKALQEGGNGELSAADFEVALIDRTVSGRAFRRLEPSRVEQLLSG